MKLRVQRRVVRLVGRVVLAVLATLLVAVVLLFASLDTTLVREQIRTRTNAALADLFMGRIDIVRLGHVGLYRLSGVDVRVADTSGRPVLDASGLSVEYSLPALLVELLSGDAPRIQLGQVGCDHARVELFDAPEGVSLASAFRPKESSQPDDAPSKGEVRVQIAAIALNHVWVHGQLTGAPLLDVELAETGGRFAYDARGVRLDIDRGRILGRALPFDIDPDGALRAALELPNQPTEALFAFAEFHGTLLESAAQLRATLAGDNVDLVLDVGPVPAESLQRRLPELALRGDSRLSATFGGTLERLNGVVELENPAARLSSEVELDLAERVRLTATSDASQVNVSGLVEGAPASDLNAHIEATLLEQGESGWSCQHRIVLAPGMLSGFQTPHIHQAGSVRFGASGLSAQGDLGSEEPGLELSLRYAVRRAPTGSVGGEASLLANLERPQRLFSQGVDASGTVRASASYEEDGRTVVARVEADLPRLARRNLQVTKLRLRSDLGGNLEQPEGRAELSFRVANGSVRVAVWQRPHKQRVELLAKQLELAKLQEWLGDGRPTKGTLALQAELSRVGRRVSGFARVDVPELGASARLTLADATVPSAAPVASLGGGDAFRGSGRLNGAFELATLEPLLRVAAPELERVAGRVAFDVQLQRPHDEDLQVTLDVDTRGLTVVQKRRPLPAIPDTESAVENEPLALEGIDLQVRTAATLPEGRLVTTVLLRDRLGPLVRAQGKTTMPERLWRDPSVRHFAELPLEVDVEVPRRRLAELPSLMRPPLLDGGLSARLIVRGTASKPKLTSKIALRDLRTERSLCSLDLVIDTLYETSGGKLEAQASAGTRSVGTLLTNWEGDLRGLKDLGVRPSPVVADATLVLSSFPTDVVPTLTERSVEGELSGKVEVRGWGRAAKLDARLESESLSIAKVKLRQLSVSAGNARERLAADIRVLLGDQKTTLRVDAAMPWGNHPYPTFARDVGVELSSRGFELATLRPLVSGKVSELGGKLNADARVRLSRAGTEITGTLEIDDGILQVPAVGQRFTNIRARAVVGNQRVELKSLSARGLTGRVTAQGSADFAGTALRSAEAKVKIAEREKMPLTIEGQAVGDAWGDVELRYRTTEREGDLLDVEVKRFTLITPESGGNGLQRLDREPSIRVGTRNKSGEFATLPMQRLETAKGKGEAAEPTLPLHINLNLRKVRIDRDRTASARLRGRLEILAAEEVKVNGRVELQGGRIDVQGKTFEIEQGTITFDGKDAANPTITATARWDSPTDHVVYAEYVGDVENGRIKLRAEPPLTNDEIASLLLFGNTDGTLGNSGDDEAALAVSVAGSTVSKGLNQVLSDFTTLDVSTRIDTSTGSSRPEVVIQVTPRLAAKVTRAMGEPTAGESPDRTFLTLELRLQRAWALSALVGDRGASALDLIWRKRY